VLFYTFQGLAERYKLLKLLVVGDGVLMGDLKKLAKDLNITDKINFAGTREDIPNVLSVCDIFVLPSHREGYP
jgi:glycosyltransferase involved in cell wall biosynthesis